MQIEKHKLDDHNEIHFASHKKKLEALRNDIPNVEDIVRKLIDFQIAIPSWALGTGGNALREICRGWRTEKPGRKD